MSHAIRNRVRRYGVAVVALALLPGLALSAGEQPAADEAKAQVTVRVITDATALQQVRASELAEYLRLVGEDLRLSTEARVLGTPAPELKTTEVKVLRLPSGMQKARLGVEHLHTAVVRLDGNGEQVSSCVEGHATPEAAAAPVAGTPKLEEQ